MAMYSPPRPGEFITDIYLAPNGISGRELAEKLDVAASTLSRILKGTSRVTSEMALRLSKAVGRFPESWSPCRTLMTFGSLASMSTCNGLANSNWPR